MVSIVKFKVVIVTDQLIATRERKEIIAELYNAASNFIKSIDPSAGIVVGPYDVNTEEDINLVQFKGPSHQERE